jgi:hypothetical protein
MMEAIDNGQCFNPTSPSRLFLLQSWSPSMGGMGEREISFLFVFDFFYLVIVSGLYVFPPPFLSMCLPF